MKLLPEVKAKWLEALRSGRYSQAQGSLHVLSVRNPFRPTGHCCLGVLAAELGVSGPPKSNPMEVVEGFQFGEDRSVSMPPNWWINEQFEDKTGKIEIDEELTLRTPSDVFHYLADNMNDKGLTFSEIANWIEEHL